MKIRTASRYSHLSAIAALAANYLAARPASADAITDWNEATVLATKGFNGSTGTGLTLDSNLGSRIEAIEARAVFDAVNSIDHFNDGSYYYAAAGSGSAPAAAAEAAHDVILGQIPDPAADPTVERSDHCRGSSERTQVRGMRPLAR